MKALVSFGPALIISVINLCIPTLTKIFTAIEAWDYKETEIKNEIWRSYISKLFNLGLFIRLNFSPMFINETFSNLLGLEFK